MDKEEIIMQFKRYRTGMDDLLKVELANLYHSSSENDRIQITKIINDRCNDAYMPDEWGALIMSEGRRNEKIALAKFGDCLGVKKLPSGRDFESALLEETDELIKYALFENPNYLSDPAMYSTSDYDTELFKKANFLEKLAFVRNPNIAFNVLYGIYDYENNIFNLSDEQRVGLIKAFLGNDAHLKRSHQFGGNMRYEKREGNYKYNKIWNLIFPRKSGHNEELVLA